MAKPLRPASLAPITGPGEDQNWVADPRWPAAVHEAGHAVVARVLGLRCGEAEITETAEEGITGSANTHPGAATMDVWAACPRRRHRRIEAAYRARAMACQAGEEAEMVIIGSCPPRAVDGDLRDIGGMLQLRLETCPLRVFALERRLRRFTRQIVLRHRAAVARVAVALMERNYLDGADINALILAAPPPRLSAFLAAAPLRSAAHG